MELALLQQHIRELATLPETDAAVISCYMAISNGSLKERNAFDQQVRSTLQQLQYRCGPHDGFHEFEKTLNRAGEEPWELVTVVINKTGTVYPVFKRPQPCRETHQAASERTEPRRSG